MKNDAYEAINKYIETFEGECSFDGQRVVIDLFISNEYFPFNSGVG
jgi:hypothetical protein